MSIWRAAKEKLEQSAQRFGKIESGVAAPDDPGLKGSIASLKAIRPLRQR